MEETEQFVDGEHDALGLGLRFAAAPPGLVAAFEPQARHRGPPGFLHGGVAATCLDETMASLSIALDQRHSVTATLELRYRKPVPLDGRPVRIEVWREDPAPRRRHRVFGRLLLADGTVAVEAKGIFLTVGERAG